MVIRKGIVVGAKAILYREVLRISICLPGSKEFFVAFAFLIGREKRGWVQ